MNRETLIRAVVLYTKMNYDIRIDFGNGIEIYGKKELMTKNICIYIKDILIEEIYFDIGGKIERKTAYHKLPKNVTSFLNNWANEVISKENERIRKEKERENKILSDFFKNFKGE